jgi:hypothetical protein
MERSEFNRGLPSLPNLPNGIFLSHSIGVESLLLLFHRDEIFFALISSGW